MTPSTNRTFLTFSSRRDTHDTTTEGSEPYYSSIVEDQARIAVTATDERKSYGTTNVMNSIEMTTNLDPAISEFTKTQHLG